MNIEPDPCLCAYCGAEHTHQFVAVVHNRPREDGPVQVTVVHQGGPAPEAFRVPENPSTRRQGVSIGLSCEGCEATTWIHIEQNRGRTLLRVSK